MIFLQRAVARSFVQDSKMNFGKSFLITDQARSVLVARGIVTPYHVFRSIFVILCVRLGDSMPSFVLSIERENKNNSFPRMVIQCTTVAFAVRIPLLVLGNILLYIPQGYMWKHALKLQIFTLYSFGCALTASQLFSNRRVLFLLY